MTVSTATNRVQYNTNGTTGPWSVPFYFLEDGHLAVTHTSSAGVETLLVLTTNYSVTGAGDEDGGLVTTVTAYAAGGTITIRRNVPATQETDYVETDSFPAEAHERALDKLTMIAQQTIGELDSTLRVPEIGTVLPKFPAVSARANRLAAFDADGNPTVAVPADQSAAALALLLASSSLTSEGAGAIGFDPDLAYPAGTVGAALIQQKTLPDFGAVGDGVTNDATAVQTALTEYAGRVIDGLGRTYKCNSVLTGLASGTTLCNMTLDFSGISTASAKYLSATGTKGSAVALSANLAVDAVVVSVGSTATFAAEQWAWLDSTAIWATIDSTAYGQFVKVKSVDSGTQLTLYAGPIVAFNTAASATISPVTPVTGVKFENVKVIGSGANSQYGLYISYGLDCVVAPNCTFTDCDNTAVTLSRSVNCHAAPSVLRARAVGLAYGIAILNGSLGCAVDGGYGEDVRHYVTVGDNDGISINCRATHNVVMYARSAGIDSHGSSFNFLVEGNQITLADGFGAEGITLQGLNAQAIGNTVRGVTGVGIYLQPLVTASGYANKGVARGNHVHTRGATAIGVYFLVNATNAGGWESGDMDGNHVYGDVGAAGSVHFYVLCNAAKTMKGIVVRGNVSVQEAADQGMMIRTLATGSAMEDVVVSSNVLRCAGVRTLYLLADGSGSTLDDVILTDNIIEGGSTAAVSVVASGGGAISTVIEDNNLLSAAGLGFEVSGAVTGLRLKSARHYPPITVTAATDTVIADSDVYICNRAGTITLTLPSAGMYNGRELMIRTIQAQAVDSASSNVVPRTSATAGTSILPATDGAWAILKSDGSNWQTVAGS